MHNRTFFPTSFSSELAVRVCVCVCAQHSTILNKKRNPRAPKHVPDNDVWNNVKLQLNIWIQYCTVRSRYFVNHPPATRTRIQATRSRTPNNPLLHAHVCLSVRSAANVTININRQVGRFMAQDPAVAAAVARRRGLRVDNVAILARAGT
jgi:hypothetical protein